MMVPGRPGAGNATSGPLSGGAVRRLDAGDPAEHRARREPAAAGVIEVEQAAAQLAAGVQAGNRVAFFGEHVRRARVDREAAERERDAAGDLVRLERRRGDHVRPGRLARGGALGAPAVLDVGVERDLLLYGLVVALHGVEEADRVDAVELAREIL